jgi:hypothetical protein
MIIFGWRTKVYILGLLQKRLCGNCHNETYWLLKKITKWFTLFFITVLPVENNFIEVCPICDRGLKLYKDAIKKTLPVAVLNLKLAKGIITPEQYNLSLHALEPTHTLDTKFFQDIQNIKRYITQTATLTPVQNKLIGSVLLIPVIPLWIMGDARGTYNGYLIFSGWAFLIAAIFFFNKKALIFNKSKNPLKQ